ncbi:hypothetical protein [Saccharomonospora halophila]|uniref:hypothetical protein n=1 Tax=Saccharomonospora halophila TaxID=129922 RepID=UPI0012FCCC6C|nr:hypothetical protein [Saccharomonospora halophila]
MGTAESATSSEAGHQSKVSAAVLLGTSVAQGVQSTPEVGVSHSAPIGPWQRTG